MDYAVLWLLAMVTCLLLTALAAGLFSSLKKPRWRRWGMFLIVGFLTFLFGIVSLLSGLMHFNNLIIPSWLFPYDVSFALVYLIASIMIWRKGLVTKAEKPPARAWRRGILASCLFLGIVLTMTTYNQIDLNRQIEFSNVNNDLIRRLQEIWPSKPPPHLNAFPMYKQASDALTTEDRIRIIDYIKADQKSTKPEITELIERNQGVIDMLHLASQRPVSFLGRPTDTSMLIDFEYPEFPRYRQLAGLLGLKAKKEALSGNLAGAFDELTIIRSMARHLRNSPNLVSYMYSWALTEEEFDFTEYCLSQTHSVNRFFAFPISAGPSVLQSCKGMLTNESAGEVRVPFLMMQQKKTIEDFIQKNSEMLKSIGASPPMVLLYVLKPFPRSLWRVFIGQSYVENVRNKWELIKQITESGYKQWRDFSRVKTTLDKSRESLIYPILGGSFGHLLNSPYIYRIISIDVYHQIIDIAIAVSGYLEAKGSYPDRVDDLVPVFLEKVPIDPFDGKPLKIKKVPGGLDIYSTGPDPKDFVHDSKWGGVIHFYLGREAYEKYRVEPAKLERAREVEKRKGLERKRMEREKLRKSGAAPVLKKKRKPKNK